MFQLYVCHVFIRVCRWFLLMDCHLVEIWWVFESGFGGWNYRRRRESCFRLACSCVFRIFVSCGCGCWEVWSVWIVICASVLVYLFIYWVWVLRELRKRRLFNFFFFCVSILRYWLAIFRLFFWPWICLIEYFFCFIFWFVETRIAELLGKKTKEHESFLLLLKLSWNFS